MKYTLKKAKLTDLDQIRGLYWKLIDSSTKYAKILQWKKNIYPIDEDWIEYIKQEAFYLFYEDEHIVGCVGIIPNQAREYAKINWNYVAGDDEVLTIHMLMIDPDFHGKKLATKMLDQIVQIAKDHHKKVLRLDVLASNQSAINLYTKYGFNECGRENVYYESTGIVEFIFDEYILE